MEYNIINWCFNLFGTGVCNFASPIFSVLQETFLNRYDKTRSRVWKPYTSALVWKMNSYDTNLCAALLHFNQWISVFHSAIFAQWTALKNAYIYRDDINVNGIKIKLSFPFLFFFFSIKSSSTSPIEPEIWALVEQSKWPFH